MDWSFVFFFNSVLLGIGLAMDAFSVSLANGLSCPCMPKKKMCLIAGIFAFFQAAMPLLGWFAVHTAAEYFEAFRPCIPWIALGLLGFLGGKMMVEGLKNQEEEQEQKFKNNTAKKLFEKLQKHAKEQKKKADENYTLDNMIKKYCTHNKVGINILNVWDMTYYQFSTMFNEYCNGRQCDFNDMMAANTFSYKKSTDYKPLDYIKKLKNN